MANHQLLDNITHKDLKVILDRTAWYGDDVACCGVFPIEFRRVQAEYPIVFRKNGSTGHFESVAMFGFAERENLFLNAHGWGARYVPLSIERQPFLIGFKAAPDGGAATDDPVVFVDMDSPRISTGEDGVAVFLEHGGHSPYLEHINSVLKAIHEGHAENQRLSEALTELELLEPFTLDVTLNDKSQHKLAGFYTIDEDKLAALDGDALATLHSNGWLASIYMVMASIENFGTLIDKKNAR